MAKEQNITEMVQTLQEAQQNKDSLNALTASLEHYINQQKKGLEELETIFNQVKQGKVVVKKKSTYKSKNVKQLIPASDTV